MSCCACNQYRSNQSGDATEIYKRQLVLHCLLSMQALMQAVCESQALRPLWSRAASTLTRQKAARLKHLHAMVSEKRQKQAQACKPIVQGVVFGAQRQDLAHALAASTTKRILLLWCRTELSLFASRVSADLHT